MARAPCLSEDITSFDVNSIAEEAQMPIRGTGPTIADLMWLDFEPTSKAHLARCLAHLYEYQGCTSAKPLPNFDEFLDALARPHWKWTPQANTLFRRIGRIIQNSRGLNLVQVTEREIMGRRRAALQRLNYMRDPIGGEASEATGSTTQGSLTNGPK